MPSSPRATSSSPGPRSLPSVSTTGTLEHSPMPRSTATHLISTRIHLPGSPSEPGLTSHSTEQSPSSPSTTTPTMPSTPPPRWGMLPSPVIPPAEPSDSLAMSISPSTTATVLPMDTTDLTGPPHLLTEHCSTQAATSQHRSSSPSISPATWTTESPVA